ncbi:MAG: hypothetical protein JNL98_22265 [Bryobacterales bacterium]|nr:hypothetical protein [Bryobacterales bacterium]
MKKLLSTITLTLFACAALFAGVDGKWTAETKRPQGKDKRGNDTITTTFDFKSDGGKLTGTVSSGGRRAMPAEITDGKIDGNAFSFKTVQKSKKKGDVEIEWKGTVEGDQLKLSRMNKGGKRAQEMVAKRQ